MSYYDEKTETIVLRSESRGDYCIDLKAVYSPESLVDWIYHLLEKNWVDGEMIKVFLELLDEAFGKKYGKTVREKFDCYGK